MRIPLLVALAGSAVACAVPNQDVPTESASTTATAVIVVERSAGPGDAVRGDAVIARFVRVRQGAVDDTALRMTGIGTDIPSLGTCTVPTDSTPISTRNIELLDVGQVTLSNDATLKSTLLLPRSMPDPAGVMSGVVYSSRSADVFAPSSQLSLRSSGGADMLDGFTAIVTAPRDVSDVRVNGTEVTWDATDADAHDLVYVDIMSSPSRIAARCATTDAGHIQIAQLAGLEEGQVAVHRLHKESFRAKGIDPGEVRFDVARVVTFRK